MPCDMSLPDGSVYVVPPELTAETNLEREADEHLTFPVLDSNVHATVFHTVHVTVYLSL